MHFLPVFGDSAETQRARPAELARALASRKTGGGDADRAPTFRSASHADRGVGPSSSDCSVHLDRAELYPSCSLLELVVPEVDSFLRRESAKLVTFADDCPGDVSGPGLR
jgi:hypothetical protein